jgi:hypothetical protein
MHQAAKAHRRLGSGDVHERIILTLNQGQAFPSRS